MLVSSWYIIFGVVMAIISAICVCITKKGDCLFIGALGWLPVLLKILI